MYTLYNIYILCNLYILYNIYILCNTYILYNIYILCNIYKYYIIFIHYTILNNMFINNIIIICTIKTTQALVVQMNSKIMPAGVGTANTSLPSHRTAHTLDSPYP